MLELTLPMRSPARYTPRPLTMPSLMMMFMRLLTPCAKAFSNAALPRKSALLMSMAAS